MGSIWTPHASFRINSKDLTSGSIEDFEIELHHLTFSQDPNKQYYSRCEDVLMPHNFYNINASNNVLLVQEENGAGGYDTSLAGVTLLSLSESGHRHHV